MSCYCGATSLPPDTNFQCKLCKGAFHKDCLESDKPSKLAGDVLYEFTCKNCSATNEEEFIRMKLQWCHVLMLTLYNLALQDHGKCHFYHYQRHICTFVEKNWSTFFGSKKMTKNWDGTIAGTLSTYCPAVFESGTSKLNESGWWALKEFRPPQRKDLESTTANAAKRKKKSTCGEMIDNICGSSSNVVEPQFESSTQIFRRNTNKSKRYKTEPIKQQEEPIITMNKELGLPFLVDSEDILECEIPLVDEDLIDLIPDSITSSPSLERIFSQICEDEGDEKEINDEIEEDKDESQNILNEVCAGDKEPVVESEEVDGSIYLRRITPYEEEKLLQDLLNYSKAVESNPCARRLIRKLKLLKLKRRIDLPIFNLDDFINTNQCMQPESSTFKIGFEKKAAVSSNWQDDCLINRFQIPASSFRDQHEYKSSTFYNKLMGNQSLNILKSRYTNRNLKPYIWLDYESKPLKLRLLEEIQQYGKTLNQGLENLKPEPISYCYVQCHHIPKINALCRDFFWPGIDISDSLQCPDFSCVVQYRKFVIGFAFMVPNSKQNQQNEAYVNFVFTHPEWRNAGIATFMIYHLIQTCRGKDLTLHVSATNPAVLLYQKFGFKIEEYIKDFYDKYFSEDSKECKHALFMRLSR